MKGPCSHVDHRSLHQGLRQSRLPPPGDLDEGDTALTDHGPQALNLDFGGLTSGIMKRAYAFVRDGDWHLVTGYKVGNLITEWIAQVQYNPEVIGYIEGAPPVPSENLTAGPIDPTYFDYIGLLQAARGL